MTDTIFMAHSGLRYLVLLAALAAIITAALGLRDSGPAGKGERMAGAIFTGLLDLQVLLGIILLTMWQFYGQLMGHLTMMVLAVAAAHAGGVMARRREPASSGSAIRLGAYVLALVLIIGGILAIGRTVV